MIYKVSVENKFSAAHALRGYKGKCENLHGHNWKVRVMLSGKKLNKTGMLMDFTEIKALLGELLSGLDHKHLNQTAPFNKINPTAENIAAYIFSGMQKRIKSKNASLFEVKVWESDTSFASVRK